MNNTMPPRDPNDDGEDEDENDDAEPDDEPPVVKRTRRIAHADLSQLAGGMVEVERTKHLYQGDEFFGLGIKGIAGAWRLAELIDVGRSQRLHDQSALVLINFDVVAHLILLNAAGPTFKVAVRLGLIERESLGVHEKKERPMPQSQALTKQPDRR